jgi:RecB family exonuclease
VLRLPSPGPEQLALAVDAGGTPAEPPPGPRADATPPAPAPPRTLSYSSLSRYAACPYRFHIERGLGLPRREVPADLRSERERGPGLDPLVRGSLVHELLEGLGAAPPGPDDVRALAAARDVDLGEEDVADLLAMVRAFAASALHARLRRAADVRREHPFAFGLRAGGPLVNGVVDVIAREVDGAALIVDYKSDHVEPGEDPEALVEASYGVQRRIYALAALRAGAPAVEVVHLFLARPGEPAARRYEAADAAALEAALHERAAGLLAGEFPVASQPHRGLCGDCPARGGLCSQPLELTDRLLGEAAATGAAASPGAGEGP